MKKMKFVSIAAALFAACVMLSSCWGTDEPVKKTDVSSLEAGEVTYSITVKSNVASTILLGTPTGPISKPINNTDGGEVVFDNLTGTSYTVKAVVSGSYLPSSEEERTVDVKFTEEKTSAVVDFNFVNANSQSAQTITLPSTGIVSTTTLVENDCLAAVADTKEEVPVLLTIPADTKITDVNGDPLTGTKKFSIVAYVPAAEQSTELKEDEETKVLVIECKPDGAYFADKEVTLEAFIGEDAAGATVVIDDNEYTVDEYGWVKFGVSHFSPHSVWFKTTSTRTTEPLTLVNQLINLKEGENTFSYERNTGWDSSVSFGGWLHAWQIIQFGKEKSTETVDATINATADGQATIVITQELIKYVIRSGFITMNTTVYGDVTVEVTPQGGEGSSSTSGKHSGGSGN